MSREKYFLALALLAPSLFAARSTFGDSASWLSPISGNWTNAANWSTNPQYPSGTNYDVTIAASGTSYTVTLSSGVIVNSVTLDSSYALLDLLVNSQTPYTLTYAGGISIQAGAVQMLGGNGDALATLANTTITGGGFYAMGPSVTLSGDTFNGSTGYLQQVTVSNDLTLNYAAVSVGNTYFSGVQTISGSGTLTVYSPFTADTLTLGSGVTMVYSPAYTQVLNSSAAALVNNGTLMVNVDTTTFINNGLVRDAGMSGAWQNNGTIQIDPGKGIILNGSYTTAGIGTMQNNGGTIQFAGALDNTNAVFGPQAAWGTVSLAAGYVTGGTVTNSAAESFIGSAGFRSVVLQGASPNDTVFTDRLGAWLYDSVTFNQATLAIENGATLALQPGCVLGGTGNIVFRGTGKLISADPGGLVIANGISVRVQARDSDNPAGGSTTMGGTTTLTTNNGLISADDGSGPLFLIVNGSQIINNGTFQAVGTGTLIINGQLTNNGTLVVNGGTIDLQMPVFDPAILSTIQRSGGEVNFSSTYDNTNKTLVLNNQTGDLGMTQNSTLIGGTVFSNTGQNLRIRHNVQLLSIITNPTMDGVNLAANMVVEDEAQLTIVDGLVLNNVTVTMGTAIHPLTGYSGGTQINIQSGGIYGTGTIIVKATWADDALITGNPLIGPGITINGISSGLSIGGRQDNDLVLHALNQGNIQFGVAGKQLGLFATTFENQGTIAVFNGAILRAAGLVNSGTFSVSGGSVYLTSANSNSGSMSFTNSIVTIEGPVTNTGVLTFTNDTIYLTNASILTTPENLSRFGGSVILNGTIAPPSGTVDVAQTSLGAFSFGNSGAVANASLSASSGAIAVVDVPPGAITNFTNVTLLSLTTVADSATLRLTNNVTLAGSTLSLEGSSNPTVLLCQGVQTAQGNGFIESDGVSSGSQINIYDTVKIYNGTLTTAPGITIRTGTADMQIAATNGALVNQGILQAQNTGRTLYVNTTGFTNNGTLEAQSGGTLVCSPELMNNGTISVLATGNLTTEGGLVDSASAVLNLQLGTVPARVSGAMVLAGTLNISLADGFYPALNSTFDLLTGSFSGQFAQMNWPRGYTFAVSFAKSGSRFRLTAAQVPTLNSSTFTYTNTTDQTIPDNFIGPGGFTQSGTGATTLSGLVMSTGPLNVTFGKLALAPTTATRNTPDVAIITSALAIATGADFDLSNHDLIVTRGSVSGVESLLKSAYAGALWTGHGLTSSTAATAGDTLAVALAGDLGLTTFDGLPVDPSDVLVQYTLPGDANLDGQVNALDLAVLARHWNQSSYTAAAGDLNFDGTIDSLDVNLVLNHWDNDSPYVPRVYYSPEFSFILTAIPEPASLFLLGLGAWPALIRRKSHLFRDTRAKRTGLTIGKHRVSPPSGPRPPRAQKSQNA